MKAPAFIQIRPADPTAARVESNIATAMGQLELLLNNGLTITDNAAGFLLESMNVTAPLSAALPFTLGRRLREPVSVALVHALAADGTRYSGGVVAWSWVVEQDICKLLVSALPSDVPAGTYSKVVLFVLKG